MWNPASICHLDTSSSYLQNINHKIYSEGFVQKFPSATGKQVVWSAKHMLFMNLKLELVHKCNCVIICFFKIEATDLTTLFTRCAYGKENNL